MFASPFGGEVGEDEIGAGAFDGEDGFVACALVVEPAALRGGVDHGVFAGDLVGDDGEEGPIFEVSNDIEVGAGRFDHEEVGALVLVEDGFDAGGASVGWVELVSGFGEVVGTGGFGAADGIAERAVEGGVEFGAVGEDGDFGEAALVEGLADDADAAIHHIGGGDDIDAGLGVEDGHTCEHGDGGVIFDIGLVGIENAIVTVRGVGIEGDIGDDEEFGEVFFELSDGAKDECFGVEGLFAVGGFEGGIDAGEESDGAYPELVKRAALFEEVAVAEAMLSREGIDRFTTGFLVEDEEGLDEIGRLEDGFADEIAQGGVLAQAAGAARELKQRTMFREIGHGRQSTRFCCLVQGRL